jgi:hypothetical protein
MRRRFKVPIRREPVFGVVIRVPPSIILVRTFAQASKPCWVCKCGWMYYSSGPGIERKNLAIG